MSWISPTGHNDPDTRWTDETKAYDDNVSTFASEVNVSPSTWSKYLVLTLTAAKVISQVRFNAYYLSASFNQISIDVYYDDAWNNIYEGTYDDATWVTKSVPAGQKSINQARVKFYNSSGAGIDTAKLYEFAFWETIRNLVDTNVLIRNYLLTSTALTDPLIALIGARLYCPRLPEKHTLPAISYFTRGGVADAEVPSIYSPSVQFDCWASNSIDAREVYRALYDALAGLDSEAITIAGTLYYIMKAREEVQGQDLVDTEIPNYFRVLTFYSITIRDTS